MSMQAPSFNIPSSGGGELHCIVVEPQGEPRGMVQFVHGMAEYIERYLPTMERLAGEGYLCFGHDHFGHGHTVQKTRYLGHLDFKSGAQTMIQDVIAVTEHMKAKYPNLPCILFGHSMGSFVVRCVAAKDTTQYAGLIPCGTGGPNPALGAGKALASLLCCIKGQRAHSDLMYVLMFGAYTKRFDDTSAFSWVNSDQSLVEEYEDDPLCGFPFTIGGLRSLLNVHGEANGKAIKHTPADLPILLIAGENDPVGDYGKGVEKVRDLYTKAGVKDVTCRLYDARHEILNEAVKATVWDDILAWMDRII